MPVILRLDGRSFSNFTKQLNLTKPFDETLSNIFIEVSKDLIKEFNVKYIYTFSDEINILLTQIPFNGRVEKINSVFSSYVTSSFLKNLYINENELNCDINSISLPSFDSRIILTSKHVCQYFKWRQDEAWRNCLNGYAQYILNKNHSASETANLLFKLNKSQIHDLLFENGINISKVPTWQKRGVAIYKKKYKIEGFNPKTKQPTISYRNKIFVDKYLNLFKDDDINKMRH